jgi:acyl carrier protein
MNEDQKVELRNKVKNITKLDLNDTANFYDNGIDSFSLVEIINTLEEFSKSHGLSVNMDALITEEELNFNAIFGHIS